MRHRRLCASSKERIPELDLSIVSSQLALTQLFNLHNERGRIRDLSVNQDKILRLPAKTCISHVCCRKYMSTNAKPSATLWLLSLGNSRAAKPNMSCRQELLR